MMSIRAVINFKGLKRAGIVNNHTSLKEKISSQGFPPGFWTGPNSHVWYLDEVAEWLASRPQERPSVPPYKARRELIADEKMKRVPKTTDRRARQRKTENRTEV